MDTFHALVARQDGDPITASVETLSSSDLPPGGVTVRVQYSSVNFKDADGKVGRLRLDDLAGQVDARPAAG
ncbi:hypothetical protein [Mycobacterium sp. E796]|uniref:hypothetical protein n=1 Tax=Mycobacterium sp. E796 TaxID=1834151 RepID=UPI000800DDAB|nr:hypothetical protein [Mycobacterium sp. E796]OBI42764.1 hypothetical protein A5706_06310 [Mycobacterium sp. E796]